MNEVLAEAYDMVEDSTMSESDFRDYTFGNPVRFHAGMNPMFFKGTRVEADVDRMLQDGI